MIAPENGGFLLKRIIPETAVASTQATGYEIEKSFTQIPSQVFKSEELTEALVIDLDFGEVVALQGFGIVNHTIPETATITLKYSSAGFLEPWEATDEIPWREKNTYIFIERTFRYVQLHIDATAGVLQIGALFPALVKFQFPHNYSWEYEQDFEVAKDVQVSDDGVHFEYPDGDSQVVAPEYEKFKITFNDIDKQHRESFKRLIRPGKKIFIPDFQSLDSHYGIVPDKVLKTVRALRGDTYILRFSEDATGETQ